MRPINGDTLLEQMKHRKEYVGRLSDPVCLVEDAPTIDAVPVARGKWYWDNYKYTWCCSHCGNHAHNWTPQGHEFDKPDFKYCPNCGAKMVDK